MVVATLLGTLKDVVGYIFTSDKWVNSFLLSIITFLEGVIYPRSCSEAADRVHKPPYDNHIPQRLLPTAWCHRAAQMLLTRGHYHGGTQDLRIPSSLMGWGQALQLAEGDMSGPESIGTRPCCFP